MFKNEKNKILTCFFQAVFFSRKKNVFFRKKKTSLFFSGCNPTDNTKEQQKQWGPHSVPLAMTRDPAEFGWHCWSNTAHPPPSSTTYVASQMPSSLLPLPQDCPYKATPWQRQMPIRTVSQSFATHSYS